MNIPRSNKRSHRCVALWLCLTAGPTLAQAPAPDEVTLEVYSAPVMEQFSPMVYPSKEQKDGREGWVIVNFMVDTAGKPYEVGVVESMGGLPFEETAVRGVEGSTFKPAKSGDKAVDAGFTMKVHFSIKDMPKGARPEFLAQHQKLARAIEAGDQTAADAIIKLMKPGKLYEAAYFNLSMYAYYRKWGTAAQQLEALKNGIAGEQGPNYLPRKDFVAALNEELRLEIEAIDFGRALETWQTLKPLATKAQVAKWLPVITQIERLQTAQSPISLKSEIGKSGSWFDVLFRRRFHVVVHEGHVADIKLRCEKSYVLFHFDPAIEYSVKGSDGKCHMELVGEPGTRFTLVQT